MWVYETHFNQKKIKRRYSKTKSGEENRDWRVILLKRREETNNRKQKDINVAKQPNA